MQIYIGVNRQYRCLINRRS